MKESFQNKLVPSIRMEQQLTPSTSQVLLRSMICPRVNSPSQPYVQLLSNQLSKKFSGSTKTSLIAQKFSMTSTMFTTGMTGKWEIQELLVSAMVLLLRNTTLSISFSSSWKSTLGTVAISFRSGITKLSKKQKDYSHAPFRPCLMSAVQMEKSIWMRP